MYDKIGEKIRSLAIWTFIVEALASIIAGWVFAIEGEEWYGWVILILGPLVAWVGSWILYGFGEIIVKVTEIEHNTNITYQSSKSKEHTSNHNSEIKKEIAQENTAPKKPQPVSREYFTQAELELKEKYIDIICPHCNEEVSFEKSNNIEECYFCGKPIDLSEF